ncbi:MAG: hypothetical protein JWM54_1341, partial [Acidobacteriaceae bacterium]|nr:hypothetical protein [Acidobacteriaceae bacterium]
MRTIEDIECLGTEDHVVVLSDSKVFLDS